MKNFSSIDIQHWNKEGFLILKNFFSYADLDQFTGESDLGITNNTNTLKNITVDILEGESIGKRKKLFKLNENEKHCSLKLNDLYLELESCRRICLSDKLCLILQELLCDYPVIINSLTFNKGSQQPLHFDTYYMPPPSDGKMVVSSICLEDQSFDSGPLVYYPGSHLIKPYFFSNGRLNPIESEMPYATNYILKEIKEKNLKKQTFIGSKGDVFIWHSQLYHGGAHIKDSSLSRKTLVTHYWAQSDLKCEELVNYGKYGLYLKRDHQSA